MRWILITFVALIVLFLVGRVVASRATPIKPLGVIDGKLAPCPDSPNCVSSFAPADSVEHYIAPIAFGDKAKLLSTLEGMPRTTVITDEGNYIHAIQRSFLWGFIDDIEFIIGDDQIDMRSSSRTGYSDLGMNRQRLEYMLVELARE